MSAAEWRDSLAHDYATAADWDERPSTCFGCWHAAHTEACPEPDCKCLNAPEEIAA